MPHCTGLITKHFLTVRVDHCGVVAVISCGGRGDAADVLPELASCESWQSYFDGFHNPYFSMGIRTIHCG